MTDPDLERLVLCRALGQKISRADTGLAEERISQDILALVLRRERYVEAVMRQEMKDVVSRSHANDLAYLRKEEERSSQLEAKVKSLQEAARGEEKAFQDGLKWVGVETRKARADQRETDRLEALTVIGRALGPLRPKT